MLTYIKVGFLMVWERVWRLLPDRCQNCHGARGGVRGNEVVFGGTILCDYCHSEQMWRV